MKALIIRPDALGDVVLMLPMVMALRKKWPKVHITVLANAYTAPLLEVHPSIDRVWMDPFNKGRSFKGFGVFVQKLKAEKFDTVIHVFNEAPYALATWVARIPTRVGDDRKFPIRMFHTHRVRQDFDIPSMHEVDLDLQLLKPLGVVPPELGQFGWSVGTFPPSVFTIPAPYVVIHPGVGRGNRTVPQGIYRGLIRHLATCDTHVILTGGSAEVRQNAMIAEGLEKVTDLTSKTDLLQLAGIISGAQVMVSVDTGPMHLAASLGVRILNLSPSKYVKPTRWGPYGVHHRVIRPDSICSYRCFPYACKRTDCTDAFDPTTVTRALVELLAIPTNAPPPAVTVTKGAWIKQSMAVLDLRKEPQFSDADGYRYYTLNDVRGFLWRWVVVHDIGFFLVDRRLFWHPFMENILALWLYYPPKFVTHILSYS